MKNGAIVVLIIVIVILMGMRVENMEKLEGLQSFSACYSLTRGSDTFIAASGGKEEIYQELVAKASCYDLLVQRIIFQD